MTIDQALSIAPELAEMYKKENEVKEIIDIAKKIEGGARHVSVHAAGVVISPTDLTDYVPLQFEPNGDKIITQYDMYSVEETGLLKMDFLGIKNLSTLGNSVKLVKERRSVEIDIEKIPMDDKNTFEHLAKGETIGLFQLGGSGMTRYLKELKPTTVTDIMAMIALFPPGTDGQYPNLHKKKTRTGKNNLSRPTFGKNSGQDLRRRYLSGRCSAYRHRTGRLQLGHGGQIPQSHRQKKFPKKWPNRKRYS